MKDNTRLLFLCTGNTCRSVMAEGLMRSMFTQYQVASAGVMVQRPQSPTALTIAVMDEVGIDVRDIKSTPVGSCNVDEFDRIYVMESFQRVVFDQLIPRFDGQVEMLHVDGLDVSDPVGSNMDVYRQTRDTIRDCIIIRFGEGA